MDKRILASMAVMLVGSTSVAVYHKFFNKHEGIRSVITPREGVLHVNDSISFRNLTAGTTRQVWDFGDGEFSAEEAGRHTYLIPGRFRVRLTSYGSFGTLKDSSVEILVLPSEAATGVAHTTAGIEGPETVLAGKPVTYTVSTAATGYEWTVEGEPALRNNLQKSKAATFRFSSPGAKTLLLTTHSPEGTMRKQILVQEAAPAPAVVKAMPAPELAPVARQSRATEPRPPRSKGRPAPNGADQPSGLPELGDGVIIRR